jgi:uncharacterized lipoprotein YajG
MPYDRAKTRSMIDIRYVWGGMLIVGSLLLYGCSTPQTPQDLLAPTDAQLKNRSLQTRTFV